MGERSSRSGHRVPMLGLALRRRDPARSSDPRVRELVAALATLEVAPAPRAEFRAELRAQLVAVTPRLVEEGDPTLAADGTATKSATATAAAPATRKSGFRFAKPLIAAACVLTAFVLLLGGAVLLSQKALPGDALYGLKRASEDTEYNLTGGKVAKGNLKLEFAGRRIGEVADLLPRASAMAAGAGPMADSGQLNSQTSKLVRDTLGSADDDIRTAAVLLGSAAVTGRTPGPLNDIARWTPGQLSAIDKIVARIPAGDAHDAAVATRELIVRAEQRAAALKSELGCSCLTSTTPDDLGPRPCTGACTSPVTPGPGGPSTGPGSTQHPGTTSTPPANSSTTPGAPSVTPPGPGTGTAPPATASPGGTKSGTKTGGGLPITVPKPPTSTGLPITVPGHSGISLPNPLPKPKTSATLPIGVTTSCVSIPFIKICKP